MIHGGPENPLPISAPEHEKVVLPEDLELGSPLGYARLATGSGDEPQAAIQADGREEGVGPFFQLQCAGQDQDRRQDLRSEEHTSELQSRENLVCRRLLEK